MRIELTEMQALSLAELISQYLDHAGVLLTHQGDSVYVAFGRASFYVATDGTYEEVLSDGY